MRRYDVAFDIGDPGPFVSGFWAETLAGARRAAVAWLATAPWLKGRVLSVKRAPQPRLQLAPRPLMPDDPPPLDVPADDLLTAARRMDAALRRMWPAGIQPEGSKERIPHMDDAWAHLRHAIHKATKPAKADAT